MALAHVCLSLHQRSPSITQEAICQKNECLSHSDLSVKVIALSNALTTQLNLRPGQVAAVLSSNTDVFLYSLMAIVDAGGIVAPLNTRWSAQEAAAATQLCHATFLFAEPSLTSIVTDIFKRCSRLRAVVWLGQAPSPHSFAINAPYVSTNTLMQAQLLYTHTPRTLQLQQPSSGTAFICFTSGTTGTPKGVALSHTALHYQSMAKLATVGYSRDDIYLHMAPLFHVGGISSALAVTAAAAGRHVLMPRYSAAEAWRLMKQHRVTALIAVPTMIDDLARHGAAQRSQGGSAAGCVSSVTKLLVGAGGMSQQLQDQVAAVFPNADIWTAYGMSEAASSITFLQLHSAAGSSGSSSSSSSSSSSRGYALPSSSSSSSMPAGAACVGFPSPCVQVSIELSQEQQQQQQQQQQQAAAGPAGLPVGEVLIRGPITMVGYVDNAAENSKVMLPGGWLRTGDLGWQDSSGCLWLLGRAKDMVKSGGENVYASEVEAVLLQHPGVAAAAVVGVPDARLGEKVAVLLVLREGWAWQQGQGQQQQGQDRVWQQRQQQGPQDTSSCALPAGSISAADLAEHCRAAGLSGYKVPRAVAVAPGLPLNSSGKVVRSMARDMVMLQLGMAPVRSRL